jgi:calnexin
MKTLLVVLFGILALGALANVAQDEEYTVPEPQNSLFHETFQSGWNTRWVISEDENFDGEWTVERGSAKYGIEQEKGLIVNSPAKKHAISILFPSVITTTDNDDLVVQYEVRLHNKLECGGAYIKLIRNTEDMFTPEEFGAQTDYVIMFGPDKCGTNNKIHFIFKHKNPVTGEYEEKHLKNPPSFTIDTFTHLYTLIVKKDNSFEIFVDQKSVRKGSLLADFDPAVNPPEMIDDPTDLKPADWVDEAKIVDPEASKPEDWDEDAPQYIPDPDAKKPANWLDNAPDQVPDPAASKPEDWDDELDGEWEAPMVPNPACESQGCGEWNPPKIKNPAYKGKWTAPLIDNPEYKGEWKAKQIPNPDYFTDDHPHLFSEIAGLGIELWTMQDGIQFDNIYIGRDPKVAHSWAAETFLVKSNKEKADQKAEDKKAKKDKIEASKQKGTWGKVEAYSEMVGDFIGENPIPVFFTIVALLIGMVVFFEYRRPRTDDAEEELEPEKAQELLRQLKAKLEAEGKLKADDKPTLEETEPETDKSKSE